MPKSKVFLIVFFASLLLLIPFFRPGIFYRLRATVNTCSVSVWPGNISPNSTGKFIFTVGNDGGTADIVWVKITSPSTNYILTSTSAPGGFVGQISGSEVVFNGGVENTGASFDYEINVETGSETSQSAWVVQTSDSPDGEGAVTCSGNTQTVISDSPPDYYAPNIVGNVNISGVDNSSTNLSWTTDENSTATINFGTTTSYGQSKSDTNQSTSHSLTLTGLTANTTYHFSITLTDQWGNSTQTDDGTFSIAQGATTTVTVTVNTTTVNTVVKTETKIVTKLIKDETLPAVKITSSLDGIYKSAPEIKGIATDNVGISLTEYSVDDGKNWAVAFMDAKIGSKSTEFSFKPDISEDGDYQIKVRATDSSGNQKISDAAKLVIDRLPPNVIGAIYSIGPILLTPDKLGNIYTPLGIVTKVTLSSVGGATSINLLIEGKQVPLTKNISSGLWSGNLNLDSPGTFLIKAESIDGANNRTERELNMISTLPAGKITSSAKTIPSSVKVYIKSPDTGNFEVWDGSFYSQENPFKTDVNGQYQLILPAGEYYLEVSALGFNRVYTSIFKLDKPTIINQDFELKKRVGITLGRFFIGMPDFANMNVDYAPKQLPPSQKVNPLIGKNTPDFYLSYKDNVFSNLSILGKPTIISFISSWGDSTPDQLVSLSQFSHENPGVNTYVVMSGETWAKAEIYKKIGGYDLKFIADPDGRLIIPLNVKTVPATFFINRRGIIEKEGWGYLNKNTLLEYIVN